MNIKNAWDQYLLRHKIELSEPQRMVADTLIGLIREDEEIRKFFTARRTGVSFLHGHLKQFCNEQALGGAACRVRDKSAPP